jgi:hypothetical protein
VLAETLEPRKNQGNRILMVNRNMWFHKPGLSKPAPIAQRQKLVGTASYGDVAATNYAEDYRASRLADELVDGERCLVFDLAAKTHDVTYDRIVYWVSQARGVAVKADYYTVSGKKFKSARMEHENRLESGDGGARAFISKMVIQDELVAGNRTTLSFSAPDVREIPDRVFSVNLMR